MEDTGFQLLLSLLVLPYVIAFIAVSLFIKRLFGTFLQRITKFEWQPVYTVAAIGLIIGIPYGIFTDTGWVPLVISYALGTSFYELILEWVEIKVKKIFNK